MLRRLHSLAAGPGAQARGGQPQESSASLFGTQPVCPLRPSFTEVCRHSLFLLPASKGGDVLGKQRPPASLRTQHRAASPNTSRKWKQPHVWLLGNSSMWGQLASLLTGGCCGAVGGGSQRRTYTVGSLRFGVHVCVRAYVCVLGQGAQTSSTQLLAASTKPPDK